MVPRTAKDNLNTGACAFATPHRARRVLKRHKGVHTPVVETPVAPPWPMPEEAPEFHPVLGLPTTHGSRGRCRVRHTSHGREQAPALIAALEAPPPPGLHPPQGAPQLRGPMPLPPMRGR